MNELTILKAEHDIITEIYDWLNDPNGAERKMQYVLGVHDFASSIFEQIRISESTERKFED